MEKAGEELAGYLEREGLVIEEKPDFSESTYEMSASTEYLNVRVTRKPSSINVEMSNGEAYDVSIKSTNEPTISNVSRGLTPDGQISALKEGINQHEMAIQELMKDSVSNYRYQVMTEEYSNGNIRYPRRIYREFNDVIEMMFK